jgi:hypothetical protein
MSNPMEQFVVKPIIPIKVGDIDISFTNSSLFMVLADGDIHNHEVYGGLRYVF